MSNTQFLRPFKDFQTFFCGLSLLVARNKNLSTLGDLYPSPPHPEFSLFLSVSLLCRANRCVRNLLGVVNPVVCIQCCHNLLCYFYKTACRAAVLECLERRHVGLRFRQLLNDACRIDIIGVFGTEALCDHHCRGFVHIGIHRCL